MTARHGDDSIVGKEEISILHGYVLTLKDCNNLKIKGKAHCHQLGHSPKGQMALTSWGQSGEG